jgi:hypothetical protein
LRPLKDLGLSSVEVSIDSLHGAADAMTHGRNLVDAANTLGLDVNVISVCDPRDDECNADSKPRSGEEAVPAMLRGRAAHELVDGLDTHHIGKFTDCPFEELERPTRLHVDPYGNVHICQGILAGNVWDSSLLQIVKGYDPRAHPVLGPLIEGGPEALAKALGIEMDSQYASECHACYEIRKGLLGETRMRRFIGPNQVYGEEPEPPPGSYY